MNGAGRPGGGATMAGVVDAVSVVVCCGSGGVGKTTTAAVIGLDAARRGRRVVVVTIDPARRLADALGLADGLPAVPERVELHDGTGGDLPGELWAMMLDTAKTFDGLVRRYATDDAQVDRILENPFYRNLVSALSGTQEYMAAEALYDLHLDERFDLVVVDTPPSRHTLDFLEAPGVLSRFLDHRVFKLLMLPTRSGLRLVGTAAQPILRAIGKVVGSDVLADAVAFFQAFAGMETGFRERADQVVALLRADTTAFVVVASPRHDTITEATWFAEQLVAQQVRVRAAIVNRVHPAFGDGTSDEAWAAAHAAALSGDDVVAALWRNVAELRAQRECELAEIQPLLAVAGGTGPDAVPLVAVPLLDEDVHELDELWTLAGHVFSALPPDRG